MADWLSSMQQTFEYYVVDPGTWKDVRLLENVKSCSISRDIDAGTLGSASFEIDGTIEECYVRVYLITNQNGVIEKHPLGTYLVQTPSFSFNGKVRSVTVDAYTPLLELKDNMPPIGYSIFKDENIMNIAYRLTRENVRAPVAEPKCDETLYYDFVSDTEESWLSFLSDLMLSAKYSFGLDEMGRILFIPNQELAALQPIWSYDDGNSSILYPELTEDHDIYGVPNVVEVLYSNGGTVYYAKVVNDDPNSVISTVNRGREIVHRVTDPEVIGNPTNDMIREYAEKLLRELSTIECTVTYTHGYCPVRIGDCVLLNYRRAGIRNVKAKVVSQAISCQPGCPVQETAIYELKMWG